MKNQQLRAIYSSPEKISYEQTLLEQVKEFAEIGFNKKLKEYIESNKKKIGLYTSTQFDASKYSEKYLEFLNDLILALSVEETDIDTQVIRDARSLNEHYANQKATKDKYQSINYEVGDSTLKRNVTKRLAVFKKELEALRNQQLILKAESLVELANADIDLNQENLRLMKIDYLELLSNYSLESFVAFEQKFDRLFGEKSISTFRNNFAERKRIMDGIMEECEGTPVEEVIKNKQYDLNEHTMDFESIMKEATDLKSLATPLKQVKTIEDSVTQKAGELLIPSDAHKLQELIEFIADKEKEIQLIKEGIKGASEIHQQTIRAIENLEQSIRKKKEQAEFFLQKISDKSSEAQQIEDHQEDVSTPQKSSTKSEPKNEEAFITKKNRLQEAISLIETYKGTIEKEQKQFSVKFFYKSRNQAKISYCELLAKELRSQVESLNFESNLHDIINNAHNEVTKGTGAKKELTTKGGSYFGTSRMLSLQRLLGIDEAWQTKGHSKFLVFSTQSNFHGLKTSGVIGDNVQNIVKNFYLEKDNSNEGYQELKKQVFPSEADNKLEYF
ncbi:hypothetical protein [Legionella tucsonensis]|uniref:Uncharacterized protein n=1 Tax=Legionella tucsonensis TaxID=40335 RepID=A0A0W0ZWF9_9GAMM|nr:hypothetical protein [Legionella tucsonensis]KTD73485.1 hypothetical protein Ltuc_1332 [Legionella tucsonensis]